MPDSPRVSLHMTVYNTEKYVAQAVKSILNQTYADFDLTVWDDGSTDSSPEILRKLAESDRRIRLMGGRNVGILTAHAEAAKAGTGEYLGWVDSDDLLEKTALAETVAALDANPKVGLVYTDHYEIDDAGKKARMGIRTKIPYSKDRLLVDFMTFHFRLIRRSVFDAAGGFDVSQPCAVEDYDLCLRLSEITAFMHISKPLYFYRLRRDSYTHTSRLRQVQDSIAAVQRAMVRRGIAGTHDLDIELQSVFRITKKPSDNSKNNGLSPKKLELAKPFVSPLARTPESSEKPTVSIHMTVYNARQHLAQAVESILKQTHRDFDLVLWDDGSTDGSHAILEKFAKMDPRVRVLHGKHAGTAAAHAQAIAASRGKYIGWVDSDDLLSPEALAETVNALEEHPEAGVAYTQYYDMNAAGTRKRLGGQANIPYSPERLLVDFMTFHFRLMRRSVYEAVGGIDVTMQTSSDYDLCLRLSEVVPFIHVPKPLYYWRIRNESLSHQRRAEQIGASADAVRRALDRRGLSDAFELAVEINSRFKLKLKGLSIAITAGK